VIPQGAEAPQAAGVIHTDFEGGSSKAEVISFYELVKTASVAAARAKGRAPIEGER
jgi:ribosome-binding ATPase YchF (GTP1/OBG family)